MYDSNNDRRSNRKDCSYDGSDDTDLAAASFSDKRGYENHVNSYRTGASYRQQDHEWRPRRDRDEDAPPPTQLHYPDHAMYISTWTPTAIGSLSSDCSQP
jgi:hypothetical protein